MHFIDALYLDLCLEFQTRALQTLTSLASNDEDEKRKAVAFILDTQPTASEQNSVSSQWVGFKVVQVWICLIHHHAARCHHMSPYSYCNNDLCILFHNLTVLNVSISNGWKLAIMPVWWWFSWVNYMCVNSLSRVYRAYFNFSLCALILVADDEIPRQLLISRWYVLVLGMTQVLIWNFVVSTVFTATCDDFLSALFGYTWSLA